MTSSSAYNNVLLKSPVQAQAAAAPKRDYQSDSTAAADFQQTLQNVRDSSLRQNDLRKKDIRAQDARAQNALADVREANRRQDEKLAQANNDKTTASTDNRKPVKDTSKQNESVNDADQSEQNSGDEKVCAKDKTVNTKSTDSKKTKKTEDTTEDAAATTTTTVPSSDTELPSALTIAGASEKTDEKILTTEKDLTTENADSAAAKNKNTDGTDALLTAQTTANTSNTDTTKTSTDSTVQQTIAQQTAADAAAQQAALASAATTTQNSATVPSVANPATENVPTDTAADVLASLSIDSLGTEKSAGKTAKAEVASATDADAATTSTPAQEVDAKSSFEKMLQSVARTGVSAKDEVAAANTSNNTNTSSSTNSSAADSLFRPNDTQTPAARSFVVQTAVPVPVGQPQWSQAVGERVLWLAAQNVSSAEINLHPKDLGPIQVKVSVNQEQATVSFTSHHAVVREVLDQNLNRLRDMFNEQGLNLVNVDVSDKSFSRQQGESKDQNGQGGNTNNPVEDETPVAVSAIVQKRLVDHYA